MVATSNVHPFRKETTNLGLTLQETMYRTRLVDAYKSKSEVDDVASMGHEEFTALVEVRLALSRNLLELGREVEANHVRRDLVGKLKERAQAAEEKLFDGIVTAAAIATQIGELAPEIGALTEKKQVLIRDHDSLMEKLQASEETATEQRKRIEDEMARLKQEFTDVLNEQSPLLQQRKGLELNQAMVQAELGGYGMQAMHLRTGMVSTMLDLGNYGGAFDMALETMVAYHKKGYFGVAENLLMYTLHQSGKLVGMLESEGREGEAAQLKELGLEYALEGATLLEKLVFEGGHPAEMLGAASQFRQLAGVILSAKGNNGAMEDMLSKAAGEYASNGYYEASIGLIMAKSTIYAVDAQRQAKKGNLPAGKASLERSLELRLELTRVAEQKMGEEATDDGLKAFLAQVAADSRATIVQMYASLGEHEKAHEMISALVDAYHDGGEHERAVELLEMGAEMAQGQRKILEQARRNEEDENYRHVGNYL